jgi:O-antigen/teichoic acid export membrane protein
VATGPQPRPLAPGAALATAGQVAAAASAALVAVAVARLLGPAGMGAYTIGVSLLLMLTSFGTLGLETGLVYLVGSGRWRPRRAWLETQAAAVAIGLAAGAVGIGARLLAPDAFEGLSLGLVAVVCAALPFALSWLYASSALLAADRYEDYVVPPLVHAAALLVAVASLAAAFGLEGAIGGLALAHLAAAAAAAQRSRRAFPLAGDGDRGRRLENLRQATRFGGKTYLANALQFLNYRLDLFVLNAAAAQAAVGHYSVAVSVTSLGLLLPRALSSVLFPRVSALTAGAEETRAYRDLVEAKSVRHAGLLSFGSALALVAVLVVLVPPIFGSAFRPAVGLGLILLPGVALLGVANVLMATVVGRGRPEYSLAITIVTTPVTIALYLLLIPRFDATGAAVASTVSYTLSSVLAVVAYRRVTGRRVRDRLLPTRDDLADYRRLLSAFAARNRPTPPS